jgi:hypothetical protein
MHFLLQNITFRKNFQIIEWSVKFMIFEEILRYRKNTFAKQLKTPVVSKSYVFYVHGSVHRESISINVQQDATIYSLLYFCRLLYMFWVVIPPIIRSTYNCNYSIWHWSNRLCYLPLWWRSWNSGSLTSARCCNYSYVLLMMGGVTTRNM